MTPQCRTGFSKRALNPSSRTEGPHGRACLTIPQMTTIATSRGLDPCSSLAKLSGRSPIFQSTWRQLFAERFVVNMREFLVERQPLIWLLALVIGVSVGYASIIFRWLIGIIQLPWLYTTSEKIATAAASVPWWNVILAPTIGGLAVGYILQRFTKARRAHGVADVIEARAIHNSRIDPKTGFLSAGLSALSIGCGASVGREGPVVHLGATPCRPPRRQVQAVSGRAAHVAGMRRGCRRFGLVQCADRGRAVRARGHPRPLRVPRPGPDDHRQRYRRRHCAHSPRQLPGIHHPRLPDHVVSGVSGVRAARRHMRRRRHTLRDCTYGDRAAFLAHRCSALGAYGVRRFPGWPHRARLPASPRRRLRSDRPGIVPDAAVVAAVVADCREDGGDGDLIGVAVRGRHFLTDALSRCDDGGRVRDHSNERLPGGGLEATVFMPSSAWARWQQPFWARRCRRR